jgi:hypothetical protein
MLITTNLTVSPNMKMAYSNQTTTNTITAGNLENVTITPPYRVFNENKRINSFSSRCWGYSGTHYFRLTGAVGTTGVVITSAAGTANYNQELDIKGLLP